MQEKIQDYNQDTLNAGIAQLREEIAALAAYMKQSAELRIDQAAVDGALHRDNCTDSDKAGNGWTGAVHTVGEVGERGKKIAVGLAHEIERHPVVGGIAAFGLGFLIARLLRGNCKIDGHPTSY